jgi:hypothetical protein
MTIRMRWRVSAKGKPKYTERDPNAYNSETLQGLLTAADPEDS